jgi:hypothetical protein
MGFNLLSQYVYCDKGSYFFSITQISLIFCVKKGDFREDFEEKCIVFNKRLAIKHKKTQDAKWSSCVKKNLMRVRQ